MPTSAFRPWLCLAALALATAACGPSEPPEPPVARPSVTLSRDRAPAGSPIDITYRFEVAPEAAIAGDHWVFVHVVDTDEERMWTDDHEPPVPTSQWRPGQVIEYTRTVFIPVFPYIGDAAIHLGLYAPGGDGRLPLDGVQVGQRAYRVARFEMLPQTDNIFTVFKEGWHQAEVAGDNPAVEWQWTKKEASLAFKNPKRDILFYLDVDSPAADHLGVQQVQVTTAAGETVDEFAVDAGERVLRKIRIPAARLGDSDMSELRIGVDKTVVPAQVPAANSKDPRELGVRVFHAFIEAL
jgi:hypothetical protein